MAKNQIIEHIKNATDKPNTPSGSCARKYNDTSNQRNIQREFSKVAPVMLPNEKGILEPNPPEGCVCNPGLVYRETTAGSGTYACALPQ
jgi:hypothetical protein